MKEIYCDRCNENMIHRRYGEIYRCMCCDSPNYLKIEIDNPEEMKRLNDITKQLVETTGFPF